MNQADISRERSRNYWRQLKGSALFKVGAMLASFLMLPLMIHYLGQEKYGIWSTLLSIVSWIAFFDLGIGNGLRNKVAESLAKGEEKEASNYIASAYSLVGLAAIGLCLVVVATSFAVPWKSVLNSHAVSETELRNLFMLMFIIIGANFWLGLIRQVLNAIQKTAAVSFGQLLSNILALLGLYLLVTTSIHASLFAVAVVYGVSLIASNVALSFWFYHQRRELMPIPSLHRDKIRPLLSLGIRFFIIQCAVLVLFTTDKILISHLLGPQYVTQYDVALKLFGLLTMAYGVISAPLWSAYTDAYHRKDTDWIIRILKQQMKIFVIICVVAIAMVTVAKPVIELWIGQKMKMPELLIISMAVFTIVSVWNNMFAFVVNGIGAIRLQMNTSLVGMVANIPLSIFLVRYWDMGVHGVVWATVISLLPFSVLAPFQVRALLRRTT